MIKLPGAEFRAFMEDPEIWKDGAYMDDDAITVNGTGCSLDGDLGGVFKDTDTIYVQGGLLYPSVDTNPGDAWDLVALVRRWKRKRSLRLLTVEVHVDKLEMLIKAVKAAGGRVR